MEFVHVELKRDTWVKPDMQIKNQDEAVEVVRKLIDSRDKEMLIAIHLATDGTVINAAVCSVGTINQSLASNAEILRTAILSGASRIILIHNHPSGNPMASKQDIAITKNIALACRLMNLELIDHIIIGKDGNYHSIQEKYPEQFVVNPDRYETLFVADGDNVNEK